MRQRIESHQICKLPFQCANSCEALCVCEALCARRNPNLPLLGETRGRNSPEGDFSTARNELLNGLTTITSEINWCSVRKALLGRVLVEEERNFFFSLCSERLLSSAKSAFFLLPPPQAQRYREEHFTARLLAVQKWPKEDLPDRRCSLRHFPPDHFCLMHTKWVQ